VASRMTEVETNSASIQSAMAGAETTLANIQTGMTEVETNLANIQGNVFGGFNKDHQTFLFLRFPDQAKGRTWLAGIVDQVATAEEVIAFNNVFKAAKDRRGGREGTIEATWMNVAFTFAGLQVLAGTDLDLNGFPEDLTKGMASRSDRIGDVDESAPQNWVLLPPGMEVHAILLLASDDPDDLTAEVTSRTAELTANGIEIVAQQDGKARTGTEIVDGKPQNQNGHEHFGFDDGVSQPGVRDDRVTPPLNNPDIGLPGQDRLWPGEFVLGYPRQATTTSDPDQKTNTAPGPVAVNGPSWTADGSYLVFRRLRQDVEGFRTFVTTQAGVEGIPDSVMGAKLVGRYRSGCPLEIVDGQADNVVTTAGDPSLADDSLLHPDRINAFDYINKDNSLRDDTKGLRVPLAGHIRKVYPRNQQPPGEHNAERRRILRRGVAFGESFDATAPAGSPAAGDATFPDDRGLLFLCYQRSINDQFEFLMNAWVNNRDFPETGEGIDLVIGQRDAVRPFELPGGEVTPFDAPKRWVITTGGGYFFQPSVIALRTLAGIEL
jgi:Dyp-type peroxidase family